MKVNNYAIVPAAVRYDHRLTANTLQVYMELSAAANVYGVCKEDTIAIAQATKLSTRAVTRHLTLLVETGHVKKVLSQGDRALALVPQQLEDEGIEYIKDVKPSNEDQAFCDQLLSIWEEGLDTKISRREFYYPVIAQRLANFTKEELLSSVKNRIYYVTVTSVWHTQHRQDQVNLFVLLRDDETVHKYLNLKYEEQNQLIKFNG